MKKLKYLIVIAGLIAFTCYAKAQSPIRVVCIGNSITEGYGLANGSVEAYPVRLGALLGPGYSVINCGVSGKTMFKNVEASYWSTGRLDDAKNLNPDIVIIKLGTNDSDPFRWDEHKDEFYSDYLSMINEFRENGEDPIFFVAYCAPIFRSSQQALNIKNEVIPILDSVIKNQDTYSIDFYNNLLEHGEYFPDGVHPNANGAIEMANIACDAIKNANGIVPRFIIDNDTITGQTALTLNVDDTLLFDPQPSDGIWRWTGPNGFSSESRQISINNIQRNQGGFYKAIHISPEGRKSIQSFIVTINECTKTAITPYMQVAGDWGSVTSGTVEAGGSVSFGPQPLEGTWEWSGPSGFTINSREFTLNNLKNNQEGEYIAQYYNQYGCKSTVVFNLTVSGEDVCRNNPINPYLNVNNVVWQNVASALVNSGSSITFGPQATNDQSWYWTGPNNFSATSRQFTINNFQDVNAGDYIATVVYDDTCSSSLSFTIELNNATYINETSDLRNIGRKYYPNPVTDKLTVSNIPDNTPVTVCNLHGRIMAIPISDCKDGAIEFDVSHLKTGVYFLQLRNGNHPPIKFIKQ